MIFDCHANVGWDVNNIRKNLLPTEQSYNVLLRKMNDFSIEKAIILPFPSPGGQFNENFPWYDLENHYLYEARTFSKKLIPFPGVNPKDKKSVKNIINALTFNNIKGIKFSHQIPMEFSIDQLIGHPLMKIIQDNNLIFMIHVGTGKEKYAEEFHTTLNYAIKVAKYYPDIRFIFCHLGRLHASMLEALKLENVWMDTSAFSMLEKWRQFIALNPISIFKNSTPIQIIEGLVDKGFEHKMLFGSDEPYTSQENEIRIIQNAQISEQSKRKIFYENVTRLLR